MDVGELSKHCINSLYKAREELIKLGDEGRVSDEESSVKIHKGEIVTKGDNAVSKALAEHIRKFVPIAVIQSEEGNVLHRPSDPLYLITFYEIDGTFNYQRGIFHYCSVVTALLYFKNPKFEDVIFGGVLEHTTDTLWYAVKGGGCFEKKLGTKEKRVYVSDRKTLEEKSPASFVIDEGPNVDEKKQRMYSKITSKAWVRNESCAGYHLALVANGGLDAFLCSVQKAHELGAGYRLIKEAKGVIVDFDGNPIDNQNYEFNSKYSIVAASSFELGKELIELID